MNTTKSWTYDPEHNHHGGRVFVGGEPGKPGTGDLIAEIPNREEREFWRSGQDPATVGPLIAAAPDLLAALTAMVVRFGSHLSGRDDRYEIAQARAAIAKATGKEG